MDAKILMQRGNTLQLQLGGLSKCKTYSLPTSISSPDYIINGCTQFQIKAMTTACSTCWSNTTCDLMIFVKFMKLRSDGNFTYAKLASNVLKIDNKRFMSDGETWHLIYESERQLCKFDEFDLSVEMTIVPSISSFASLYDDDELTDFQLRGEDGSVRVHKAVLAAASGVLRTMLAGAWRESKEGFVRISGTSKETLQHLKDYLYLHTLPDTGLEQLLLLGAYFIMPDLEHRCVDKLIHGMTAQNAFDLTQFATKHQIMSLFVAIMECVQKGGIEVNDVREQIIQVDANSKLEK